MANGNFLRILIITSRPLIDANSNSIQLLDVTEERRRIRVALNPSLSSTHRTEKMGAAQVHFLPEATTGEIIDALTHQWDVVHFTGHGTSDGQLLLEDEFGAAQLIGASELVKMLGNRMPRLVVLSLCFSGGEAAMALHQVGVDSVVAIKADKPIADHAAIIFAQQFYSRLSQGATIGEAFERAQTRVALDSEVGDHNPPKDEMGNPEELWSKRFKLIGDGNITVGNHSDSDAGKYEETGAEKHVGNLPNRNLNFVGRAKEIVDIVKAFDRAKSQRVAIWREGGLGKTELAKAVGWWYVERQRIDAVLWASASRDEGEYKLLNLASLLSIAGRVFGLPITEQTKFDEQKQVVREFLTSHRSLLILDNWEVIESRDRKELWDFVLSLPETTKALVTSRDILPARDAHNIELDTLEPADAVKLFLKIAHNTGYFDRNPRLSEEEISILNSICERLSGYPLAIEVVAGQMVSRTFSEIWSDLLRVPKNVLEGKDEITSEPRGVWTSLGWSYDVLPEAEKSMFQQMGIFLAPALVEDIAAIVGVENPRSVLDTLVKRSLVRMREGAYSLLPIVRNYAESKLGESGQDIRDLHARAADYYGQKRTLEGALMASEHLYELSVRFEWREVAEKFIEYVREFYQDLVTRGYWVEARRKIEQLTTMACALGDKISEAQAISELASMFYRIGEYELASKLHQQSLKTFEELGDKNGIAGTLHNLALVHQNQGDYAKAVQLYQQSLKFFEELGNKNGIASTLHSLGNVEYLQGNYDEAVRLYHKSLKLKEELGDKSGIASTLHQLAMIHQAQGNYSEAMRLYQQSLKIEEELGNRSGIASTLHQLGNLEYLQENYSGAVRLYQQSLQIAEELEDKSRIAITLHQLGNVEYLQGNYSESMQLYQQSLKIEEELGDKIGIAITLGQLGRLAYLQSQLKDAVGYFLKALAIFERLQSPHQEIVRRWIEEVRQQVGEEQFTSWMK